jgi:Uma2 family endonuclease
MAPLTIELPSQKAQTAFNIRRWNEVLADPALARFEGRIETDRHGIVLMSPPPAASHGGYQSEIAFLLRQLMADGRVTTECPISTADGVRAADVAWASPECVRQLGNRAVYPRCPEICVEILSPRNTRTEIEDKRKLYFHAGAREVWLCSPLGAMTFFNARGPIASSVVCPKFPKRVKLR